MKKMILRFLQVYRSWGLQGPTRHRSKPAKNRGCRKVTIVFNGAKPRLSIPDDLDLAVRFKSCCGCCVLNTASLLDSSMALCSKSTYSGQSAVEFCSITILYYNNMCKN